VIWVEPLGEAKNCIAYTCLAGRARFYKLGRKRFAPLVVGRGPFTLIRLPPSNMEIQQQALFCIFNKPRDTCGFLFSFPIFYSRSIFFLLPGLCVGDVSLWPAPGARLKAERDLID